MPDPLHVPEKRMKRVMLHLTLASAGLMPLALAIASAYASWAAQYLRTWFLLHSREANGLTFFQGRVLYIGYAITSGLFGTAFLMINGCLVILCLTSRLTTTIRDEKAQVYRLLVPAVVPGSVTGLAFALYSLSHTHEWLAVLRAFGESDLVKHAEFLAGFAFVYPTLWVLLSLALTAISMVLLCRQIIYVKEPPWDMLSAKSNGALGV